MPKLIVTDQDRTFLVDLRPGESLVVGRSTDCDLRIQAPRASRHHCEIAAAESGHLLRDLGSTNGTSLNGGPFQDGTPLADGDLVDAAGCRLVYWGQP